MEKQDGSEKHLTVSDSAYCLDNHDDSQKHAKATDSAYSLENQNDSEQNAKVDSAYSNSNSSNSQSRKSDSSKSTRSGSNSSGSSGYGGKKCISSNKNVPPKRSRKRAFEKPALLECKPPEPVPEAKKWKDGMDTIPSISMHARPDDKNTEPLDQDPNDEIPNIQTPTIEDEIINSCEVEGFSCAISLHDGVVRYTNQNLSANLGFPEDMWIGRSFIEFIHPRDRDAFTTQITKNLPLTKIVNGAGTQEQETSAPADQECTMACRIRRYRNMNAGFAIRQHALSYVPFVLKFSFKEIKLDTGSVVYLIIKSTPLYSAYKSPNEVLVNPVPFVIRHAASGALEYIDVESVPYLGYMPHDIHNKDALTMYHPDDLPQLKIVYETIVKDSELANSMPFRMRTHNGDYVKVTTVWTSFTNPWSMKLEFIIGKHSVLVGPATPNVFQPPPPPPNKTTERKDVTNQKIEAANTQKEDILKILKDVLTKPADTAKQHVSKRVHEIATIMEKLLEEPKPAEELRIDTQEGDIEQDTIMLGGISPHHEYSDSMCSSTTSYSYNQLNYNENLQRYFDSHLDLNHSTPLLGVGDYANALHAEQKKKAQQYAAIARLSPFEKSNDSSDVSLTSSTFANSSGYLPRLTESVLIQHNNDMEKVLAKTHRVGRSTNKINRTSKDRQQNQKEHLARCNAAFQPTEAGAETKSIQQNSLKRTSETIESGIPAKQSGSNQATNNLAPSQLLPSTSVAVPVPIRLPTVAVVPPSPPVETLPSDTNAQNWFYPQNNLLNVPPLYLPWSYPPPIYGAVCIYPFNMPTLPDPPGMGPFEQGSNGSIDVNDKPAIPMDQSEQTAPSTSFKNTVSKLEPETAELVVVEEKEVEKPTGPYDEEIYKNDGESTYSSFYSLSLNTGTGSISSNEPKKPIMELPKKVVEPGYNYVPKTAQKAPIKKLTRPWLTDIEVAQDLHYKYQVPQRSRIDTMTHHMEQMLLLSRQPDLVNEQLGQLYLDLKKQGVATRLTLKEGFTTSSSSGDDGSKSQGKHRKREYSKLAMIYEEDAPLPPPPAPAPVDPLPALSEAPVDPSSVLSEAPVDPSSVLSEAPVGPWLSVTEGNGACDSVSCNCSVAFAIESVGYVKDNNSIV